MTALDPEAWGGLVALVLVAALAALVWGLAEWMWRREQRQRQTQRRGGTSHG